MKVLSLFFIGLLINLILNTDNFIINIANAQNNKVIENKTNNTNNPLNEIPIIISDSLNGTTIKAISDSLNGTTIKAISDSLYDNTSKLVIPLIQSINSSLSKTFEHSMNTQLSTYAAAISAFFAAVSAFISLKNSRSQNRLISKQIKQQDIFLRKERELHYQELKSILNKILSHNINFLNPELISSDLITSFKLDYKIEDINNIVERNIAITHLKNDYTKFDEDLQEIKQSVNNLDSKIANFETQIPKIVKGKLSNFDLVEQSGKPIIIDYLYNYWLNIFQLFEKNANVVDKFNSEFRGIKKDQGGHFDGDLYVFGGQGIFKRSTSKSNDEKEFLSIVDNLVTDKEIWNLIQEITILKNSINDKIKKVNENIDKIIIRIDQYVYNEIYGCCEHLQASSI